MRISRLKLFITIFFIVLLFFFTFNVKDLPHNLIDKNSVSYLIDNIRDDYPDFFSFYNENEYYIFYSDMSKEKAIALSILNGGSIHENSINHEIKWINKHIPNANISKEIILKEIKNILSNYKSKIISYKLPIFLEILIICLTITVLIYITIVQNKNYKSNAKL